MSDRAAGGTPAHPVRRRPRRGFTLTGVLVAVAGFLVLGLALLSVFVVTLRGLSLVIAKSMVTGALQVTVEHVERDTHRATAVVAACGPYTSFAGSAIAPGRLVLDVAGGGIPSVDRIIYQCDDPVNGCLAANPGSLQRILATSADACATPVVHTVASSVTQILWPAPATGRDVPFDLRVARNVGFATASSRIVSAYNFRN